MTTPPGVVVVPCYNEADRLRPELVAALADLTGCDVLLVDDGSTDGTAALLATIISTDPRVSALSMERNSGKAEAVRRGLLHAMATGAPIVGFTDADFATPPDQVARLVHVCRDRDLRVVFGARVALLGHGIERSLMRHYTGRLFATISSAVLGFDVYDTQCGAKVFAAGDGLRTALKDPFVGRWSFDVELLGRLAAPAGVEGFLEVPLDRWHEIPGSKLGLGGSMRATAELFLVARRLRRYRH